MGHCSTGKKIMRSKFVVAQSELRRGSPLQPRAVAIIPFRRRVNVQLARQLDFCGPLEGFKKVGRFNL